jgi:endonuclease-3
MGSKIVERAAFIYDEISKLYPNALCELNHTNALELMIAIMLSAQTTDIAVNKVTKSLFEKYKSIDDYIIAPLEEIEEELRYLGLYKNKAKNIKGMVQIIKEKYHGEFLNDQDILESLPGVGRKTANVFLAEWYKVPRIAVDTHVKRISARLGLAEFDDSPENVEKKLMKVYPKSQWISTHHKFIFFGRYFCKAIHPNCELCTMTHICKTPFLK